MITVSIDLTKEGYEELAELMSSYAVNDSVVLDNVAGSISSISPEGVEIKVDTLDIEDYMYEVPDEDETEEPEALA
jgi:hypothetical protein|tara:strand:- start:1240 stop:1467 length:228 start_codon:yes stop_codon:yes gene_type:complete